VGVLVTLRLDKEEQNEGREEKQQLPGLCHALLSVMLPGSIYRRIGRGVGEVSVQLQSADQTVLCVCFQFPLLVLCFWSTQ